MIKEQTEQTKVLKVEGRERWHVVSNRVLSLFGSMVATVGYIEYEHAAREYRYKTKLTVLRPQGYSYQDLKPIVEKLEELNNIRGKK